MRVNNLVSAKKSICKDQEIVELSVKNHELGDVFTVFVNEELDYNTEVKVRLTKKTAAKLSKLLGKLAK